MPSLVLLFTMKIRSQPMFSIHCLTMGMLAWGESTLVMIPISGRSRKFLLPSLNKVKGLIGCLYNGDHIRLQKEKQASPTLEMLGFRIFSR